MKLALAATSALATQAFIHPHDVAIRKSPLENALIHSDPKSLPDSSSNRHLTTPSLRSVTTGATQFPLSLLKAEESQDSIENSDSVDNANPEGDIIDLDTIENEEIKGESGSEPEHGIDILVNLVNDLVNKYGEKIEQDVDQYGQNITHDLNNVTETLIKLLGEEGNKQLNELNNEIKVVEQKIDDLKGYLEEIQGNITSNMKNITKWAESTIKFAEESAPDIIKINQTRIDEIKDDINEKMSGPVNALKNIWRTVETFFKPDTSIDNSTNVESTGNHMNHVDD